MITVTKGVITALAILLVISGTGQVTAQTNAPGQSQQDSAQQAQFAQWKKAIEDIFRMRLGLRQKLLKHQINKRVYAAAIAAIDTTACPESFRLGWTHYVTAWQKLSTDPSGLVPLVEIVLTAHTGHVVRAAHEVDTLAKEEGKKSKDAAATTTAMRECQEAAVNYDASLAPD